MKRVRVVPALCAGAIILKFLFNLGFVLETGERTAYIPRMTIDSDFYLREGARISMEGIGFKAVHNLILSPGQQIFVAAVLSGFGGKVLPIKVLLAVLHLLTAFLTVLLARRLLSSDEGAWVAGLGVGLSNSLHKYSATLQYETLIAFLMTSVCVLLVWAPASNGTKRFGLFWRPLVAGVLAAVLCMFRVHFIGVFVISLLAMGLELFRRRGDPGAVSRIGWRSGALAGGFLAAGLFWNLGIFLSRGEPVFFHEFGPQVGRYLHANDLGYNYPYRDVAPPAGMRFVVERPFAYFRLLLRRQGFLWGFTRDVWSLDDPYDPRLKVWGAAKAYDILFRLAFLGLFILGWTKGLRTACADPGFGTDWLIASSPVLTILGAVLVVSAASRFLVAAIPVIVVFQVQAGMLLWDGAMTFAARRSRRAGGPENTSR